LIFINYNLIEFCFKKELYLGCNDIHTDGGLEIARVVKNMPSLKVLDLNG
jgi:hypothetical protein